MKIKALWIKQDIEAQQMISYFPFPLKDYSALQPELMDQTPLQNVFYSNVLP